MKLIAHLIDYEINFWKGLDFCTFESFWRFDDDSELRRIASWCDSPDTVDVEVILARHEWLLIEHQRKN